CLDPATSTLDPADPAYVALRAGAADTRSPYPYEYGESIGAPRYDHAPTADEQRSTEWDLDVHRAKLAALEKDPKTADAKYAGIDLAKAGAELPELPTFSPVVREARAYVAPGSTIAWSRAFDLGDRTFLVTSDQALVPKDRVRPYPKTSFHGVLLEGDTKLPIAFFRKQDRPKLRLDGDAFVETGASFPRLSWVMLTGSSRDVKGERFLETREAGTWVRAKDAAVAEARSPVPYRSDEDPGGRHTWVDVSVLGGTLVAYEGERPVFATLISAGRGGIPFPGKDPVSTASTPTGSFRVDGKFKTATMVSSTDSNVVHSEVQYVQNFHGPHALHGAYWHDAWGELKSGGCVNLSPRDSAWLFDWSDPKVPADWFGVRSVAAFGVPTRVLVRP
ncbi:MAG TPA: L,D-transpeptidase, partial [Polyangiaceae bacterium]|nr:L,D-transpeptidase [Polyangiaceae bacterium]